MEERKIKGASSKKSKTNEENEIEVKRANARKIWEKSQENLDNDLKKKETSMLASQGKSDHSGSAYHGPGNIDHEKVDSNMAQRNFDNHQSNRLG
jgi:hypothetical protein